MVESELVIAGVFLGLSVGVVIGYALCWLPLRRAARRQVPIDVDGNRYLFKEIEIENRIGSDCY